MALIHLIYVSSAEHEQTDAELDAILEVAVRKNSARNVTGMLLYAKGSFMQILEGEADAVDEIFNRVALDPRHSNIIVLERDTIQERSFAQWSMGFRRLNASDMQKPGFSTFFERNFDSAKNGIQPGVAMEMLLSFGQDHRLL